MADALRRWWDSPYRELLVPISPREADLGHWPRQRRPSPGKSPARPGAGGGWDPIRVPRFNADRATLEAVLERGGGLAVKTGVAVPALGAGLLGIDIDVEDPDMAAAMAEATERLLGPTVRRVGRAPRVMLFYRADFRTRTVNWDVSFERAGELRWHKLDTIGRGLQIIVEGRHKLTGEPYGWPGRPLWQVAPTELPLVTRPRFEAARAVLGGVAAQHRGSIGHATKFALAVFHFRRKYLPFLPKMGLQRHLPVRWFNVRYGCDLPPELGPPDIREPAPWEGG